MKTYVKKIPFKEETLVDEEFVSLVLTEEETFWAYAEDHTCYPYMHSLIDKKINKAKNRYKKPVKVFDVYGTVVKEVS